MLFGIIKLLLCFIMKEKGAIKQNFLFREQKRSKAMRFPSLGSSFMRQKR